MKIYIDTSVLIRYLYDFSHVDAYENVCQAFHLFRTGKHAPFVSLYAMSELLDFVNRKYQPDVQAEIYRDSLKEVSDLPVTFLNLPDRNHKRQFCGKIKMKDSTDIPHVEISLLENMDGILTLDAGFQDVREHIAIYSPEDLLRT